MRKLNVLELNRLSVEEFKLIEKLPLTLVLDNIRSQYNVGSMFRSADAFKLREIILCGITGTPPSVEIHKTALGAEDSMDWEYTENCLHAIRKLQASGCKVFAIEQVEKSLQLNDWVPLPKQHYAIILGNEVKGVQQDVIDICDGCLEIPQYGTKHSLNVANAAAIVMWHYVSKICL